MFLVCVSDQARRLAETERKPARMEPGVAPSHIRRVLDERPSHTAPAARFRNELEDYMSEEYADETMKTIVSWGRYAELFAYDEQSELFSLENPH